METKNREVFFDPHTAFFSLPIVYWTIIFGITIILITSSLIIHFDDCYLDLSASGFNKLLTMFKMPVAILGFFAALLAMYATNHRSEQNKASINLSDSQNKFSNYYKHLEEYESYIKNHFSDQEEHLKPIIKTSKLHKALYGNAKKSGIKISSNLEKEIFISLYNFVEELTKADFENTENIKLLTLKIDDFTTSLLNKLSNSIKFEPHNITTYNLRGRNIEIPNLLFKEFITYNINKFKIIIDTLYFDENFDENLLFESLIFHINGMIEKIPVIIFGSQEEIITEHVTGENSMEINKSCRELFSIFKECQKRHGY